MDEQEPSADPKITPLLLGLVVGAACFVLFLIGPFLFDTKPDNIGLAAVLALVVAVAISLGKKSVYVLATLFSAWVLVSGVNLLTGWLSKFI